MSKINLDDIKEGVLLGAVVFIALTILSLTLTNGLVMGAEEGIGCENYNSTVFKCWNQNPTFEKITYFSKDGTQMANNDVSRFDWVHYEMGIFYINDLGILIRYPMVMNPNTAVYKTDGNTYWQVSWKGKVREGQKYLYYRYNVSQSLYDEYVNISFEATTQGLTYFPYDLGFYRLMKDIDIWNDGLVDGMNVNNGTLYALPLNYSSRIIWQNISPWITIHSSHTSDGAVRWVMNGEDWNAIYEPTGGLNGVVGFYKTKSPPYPNDKVYTINMRWIDVDPCIVNCPAFTYATVFLNATGGEVFNQNDKYELKCSLYDNSLMGGCSLSDCAISIRENSTSARPLITDYDVVPELNYRKGYNRASGLMWKQVYHTDPATNVEGVVVTRQPGHYFSGCLLTDLENTSKTFNEAVAYATRKPFEIKQTLERNITLVSPVNYFNATEGDTISFECTRGGYWTDWLALYINNTVYYNQTSVGFVNISHDVTMNYTGIYDWDCRGYTYGNSTNSWSWNGNYTLYINLAQIIQELKNNKQRISSVSQETQCTFLCWLTKLFSKRNK